MFFLFRFNFLVFLLPLSPFLQLIRSGLVGAVSVGGAKAAELLPPRCFCSIAWPFAGNSHGLGR
jgi:hypothetical protein